MATVVGRQLLGNWGRMRSGSIDRSARRVGDGDGDDGIDRSLTSYLRRVAGAWEDSIGRIFYTSAVAYIDLFVVVAAGVPITVSRSTENVRLVYSSPGARAHAFTRGNSFVTIHSLLLTIDNWLNKIDKATKAQIRVGFHALV